MYDNFIFDLYGTLVDIRTNEEKPYLWKKMSEIYASVGAIYDSAELKKEFRRLEELEKKISEQKRIKTEINSEEWIAEPNLTAVFAKLYTNKGVSCDEQLSRITAITFRTLSRQKLKVYDGVRDTLAELRKRGKGVYLLSNAQRDFTRPELELLGLTEYFDGILISSEEGCKKPSPEFFQRISATYCVPDGDWGKVSEILLRLSQ